MARFQEYLTEGAIPSKLQKRIDKFEDEYHEGDLPSDDLIQDAYQIISDLINIIQKSR